MSFTTVLIFASCVCFFIFGALAFIADKWFPKYATLFFRIGMFMFSVWLLGEGLVAVMAGTHSFYAWSFTAMGACMAVVCCLPPRRRRWR